MRNESTGIIGIDYEEFREEFNNLLVSDHVMEDCCVVICCNSAPIENIFGVFTMAMNAYNMNHSIMIIKERHLAPTGTKWLMLSECQKNDGLYRGPIISPLNRH